VPQRARWGRRDGSYIIEEFLTTGGTDVKVYTVGPRYAHAEARKSPVVDGKVTRSADGKEQRFPVLLSPQARHHPPCLRLAEPNRSAHGSSPSAGSRSPHKPSQKGRCTSEHRWFLAVHRGPNTAPVAATCASSAAAMMSAGLWPA